MAGSDGFVSYAVTEHGAPPLVMDPSDSTRLFFGTDQLNIYESGRWGTTLKGQQVPALPHVTNAPGSPNRLRIASSNGRSAAVHGDPSGRFSARR